MTSSVSHIGEGLTSCLEVPELQHISSLRSLCLHGNNISRIEGLQHLHGLQDLNLSSNCITAIESLCGMASLTSINLSSNRLQGVHGFEGMVNLTSINLSYNGITSLAGLADLQGPQHKLKMLDVRHNQLTSLQAFSVLVGCVNLRELQMAGNPVGSTPNHQQVLLNVVPQITRLDGASTAEIMSMQADMSAAQQFAAQQLASYDLQSSGGAQQRISWQPPPPARQQWQQQQQPLPGATTSTQLRTPSVDAAMSGFYQRQQGGSPPKTTAVPAQPQQAARQPANWSQGSRRSMKGGDGPGHADSSRHEQSGAGRVFVVDAAVQTADGSPGLVKQLQAQSAMLKDQLMQLTDELEHRNVLEDQAQRDMQAAMQAVQEDAYSRVEEGYKEASQAVARALQELEASRLQGQQAQDKVSVHIKQEEEAKARCAALQQDVSRLQEELRITREQAQSVSVESLEAAKGERRRRAEADEAAQDRVRSLELKLGDREAALSTLRASAAAAEQRGAALESALQQTNSTAVSMTSKIAQTMADANVQMDALKVKLAASEHQVSEQLRREAETRAEINMLATSFASQQQHHQQELERRARSARDELHAAVERERAAAEERGKGSVLLQAERDKSEVQEQLAYLKVQLQYALKENEKEASQLQEQVGQSRAEAEELQSALQAASARHKEHETLLADLTNVLQQQKSHIQALQRDKDAAIRQIRVCAPERFEQLHAENQALRRANAEVEILREQVAHHKKAWQDAERKQHDTQTSQGRQVEEIQAKLSSLEAAMSYAKEEARVAGQRAEALAQKLGSAEDAVKVKRAMLDSANDTIDQLKAEVADMQAELEDARRMAEDLEAQLRGAHEQDGTEKSNLRSEIEAGESALEQVSHSLTEAQAKLREAEAKLKASQDALKEKEAMLNYVNEEVDRVKGMFEKREGRLRDERDSARHLADTAALERDTAESRAKELSLQLETVSRDLQGVQAQSHAAVARERNAQAEAESLSSRLSEAEEEMRQLLTVVEQQKKQSASKMKQLATLLKDL